MTMSLITRSLENYLEAYMGEDDLSRNLFYLSTLPGHSVKCQLKLKSTMMLSGIPFFKAVFEYLGFDLSDQISDGIEGTIFRENLPQIFEFEAPFNIALTGERLALNLLQRSSSISTYTHDFVALAKPHKIKILDTRKTLPGLRWLDKYAVRMAGASNHRFGQTDSWMIKDNHKEIFGGLEAAINFFDSVDTNYNTLICEIHSLDEFELAGKLGVKHVMLDNFTPTEVRQACQQKPSDMTIEVSGGMNLGKVEGYFIEGVDFISVGGLTSDFPRQDISLKFQK